MKFTNSLLGTKIIETKEDFNSLLSNFNSKEIEDIKYAEDERCECPEGFNHLLQLKFIGDDGYWTVGYTDNNSFII